MFRKEAPVVDYPVRQTHTAKPVPITAGYQTGIRDRQLSVLHQQQDLVLEETNRGSLAVVAMVLASDVIVVIGIIIAVLALARR